VEHPAIKGAEMKFSDDEWNVRATVEFEISN
jgi:hypothetical protein